MVEETNETASETQETATTAEKSDQVVPLATFLEIKNAAKETKKQLDEIKAAQEEAERKSLEEKEEYKTLYENTLNERDEFKANADSLNERLTAIDAAQREKNQQAVSEEQWDKIKDWPLEQQGVFIDEIKTSQPDPDPGKAGQTDSGKFGGYDTLGDLANAAAQGVPGARDKYREIRGQ